MSEQRLITIETKISYQDDTIQTLNDIVYRQQNQIDQLEKTCQLLLERVRDLSESLATGSGATDERPPHY